MKKVIPFIKLFIVLSATLFVCGCRDIICITIWAAAVEASIWLLIKFLFPENDLDDKIDNDNLFS